MTVKDEIRGNLAKYMNLRGVKNYQLAKHVGVTNTAVGNWLSGSSSIDIENVPAVCECLGITVDALLGTEDALQLPPNLEKLLGIAGELDETGVEKLVGYADDLRASGRYGEKAG